MFHRISNSSKRTVLAFILTVMMAALSSPLLPKGSCAASVYYVARDGSIRQAGITVGYGE